MLREALTTRWPGIYFPPIPPKKHVGNKTSKFVEDRRYFLERFLRKIANHDFILISEEFKIFSRLNGDMKKSISNLPRVTPMLILERLKNNFNVSEDNPDMKLTESKVEISKFNAYFNKVVPVLEVLKSQVKALAPVTQQQKDVYLEFLRMLEDYEYNDLAFIQKLPLQKSIVNSKSCNTIKKKIKQSLSDGTNPFHDLYLWCKGEIYDLYAMQE